MTWSGHFEDPASELMTETHVSQCVSQVTHGNTLTLIVTQVTHGDTLNLIVTIIGTFLVPR